MIGVHQGADMSTTLSQWLVGVDHLREDSSFSAGGVECPFGSGRDSLSKQEQEGLW